MREKQKRKYLILSVVVGALWVCFLLFISMNVSASESDKQPEQQNHETVQDEQPEASESLAAVGEPERIAAHEQPELLEQEQNLVQAEQTVVDFEILLTLKSIEYQLKIIAGGMVLALISSFIWFTILKPIKGFTRF